MRAIVLALLLAPTLSQACWNAVRLSASDEVKGVAQAEIALQRGDAVAALKGLRALYGKQAIFYPDRISTDPALGQKARGLVAIATLRARRFDPRTGRKTNPNRRRQVVRLVRSALEEQARRAPDDPVRQARHAEALAADASQAAQARAILEPLARADLITEAEGWRTLAQLRAAAGDVTGSAAAITRCLPLADPARCAIAPPPRPTPAGPR